MSELGRTVRRPPPAEPEPAQLTLGGTEVPVVNVQPARKTRPLSPAQRAIMAHIGEHGSITSSEAGRLVHVHGPSPVPWELRRQYASSDGWTTLDRLRKSGLVVNDREARVWRAAGS